MKKGNMKRWLNLLGTPVLLIVLGLILALNPDSASALIARILGWILLLCGVCVCLSVIFGDSAGRVGRALSAVVCLAAGIYLMKNPLMLAKTIGRILGLVLTVRGISDIVDAVKRRSAGFFSAPNLAFAIVTAVIGLVLVVLPMTTSRVILTVCGIVVMLVGVAELVERLRVVRLMEKGNPDIIDADE